MDSYNLYKTKLQILFENLKFRGLLYSILLHLGFVLLYFAVTYTSDYSTYDFGTDSTYSSMPQSTGKAHKKLAVSRVVPQKPVKKSPWGTEKSENTEPTESAEDAADIANAEDLSFHPNATSPKMMGSMKQYYPDLARQMNIEATVYVAVIINKSGKVIKVKVSGVVLSKKLPSDVESDLKQKFAAAITRSLKEVRFSPPFIDGKNIPIELEQAVTYTLNR
ncbi:MAG: energy transducer TonB [Spirochaetia bacterium]|nr:energy transducer TonB [Spirochaetia bacterium]